MTKQILTFLATFVGGALIALVARAAMFSPNDSSAQPAPSAFAASASAAAAQPDPHANHNAALQQKKPVNTVCAICGMEVDPSLPTAEYKGQTIGFGCRMCPSKFKANPDKYGPAYLRNEVLEN
jgi:YHS domain-containing protein